MASSGAKETKVAVLNPDVCEHPERDSSDSDGETEPAKVFHRRISTNKDIKTTACTKDGYLLKLNPFQRSRKRFFRLKGRRLYYARDHTSEIFNEIELSNLSVAEKSTKSLNHSFQVITPTRNLVLCAESRRDMEEWITALKAASCKQFYDPKIDNQEMTSGAHYWFACSHARPVYCNVCREALPGVTSHGLSCEVCKFKVHKRCAVRAKTHCKWTTLASIGQKIIEDDDGIHMPHQWMEGNLPVSAKCSFCDKPCGSVLRLQDWRCLWCRSLVHTACLEQYSVLCPLGQCRISILPPTYINRTDSDGFWEATRPPGTSPLLVFVNTKSGNNQGVKFLRRFKQLLNPAQIFDLMNGGPYAGLRLFKKFDPFRIIVCGGDGSIGWVLSEIDKLDIHKQCQIGILPFGTGNDLARVLGWGHAIDDDQQLPTVLEKLEHSQIKMLDRWSVYTYEGELSHTKDTESSGPITVYEDSVANHLSKILHSTDHSVVLSSARVLCQTIKDFVAKVASDCQCDSEKESQNISKKCVVLNEKLESLLNTLNKESIASEQESEENLADADVSSKSLPKSLNKSKLSFHQKESLMCRANSLKKAIRQIIEHTEKAVDEQNAQTCSKPHSAPVTIHRSTSHDHFSLHTAPYSVPSLNDLKFTDQPEVISLASPARSTLATTEYEGRLSPCTSSRRISAMSTFNKSASVGSNLCIKSGSPRKARTPEPHSDSLDPFSTTTLSMLPGLSSSIAGRLAGGGFISKVLLANADALCAAASPLIEDDIPFEEYTERCVMNNYFGIGLDAKIALEFNSKRDEHPESFRSRTKNFMWYSMLGGREILHRTYKNFHQRVQLECDGQKIPLPSLQGIVILNIPSYAGGANFWGGKKENDNFSAPNFDDKILEVVAVFGTAQIAMSRVIDIQRHRIAQCRAVKITILGSEGVPVQADGEAWIQLPGCIRIVHKNRAQMLNRDRTFETVWRMWSEKQKAERQTSFENVNMSVDEVAVLQNFVDASSLLIDNVTLAASNHVTAEQELLPKALHCKELLDRICPTGRLIEPLVRLQIDEFISCMKNLYRDTTMFLSLNSPAMPLSPEYEDKLNSALAHAEVELRKVVEIVGLSASSQSTGTDESAPSDIKQRRPSRIRNMFERIKGRKDRDHNLSPIPLVYNVHQWTVTDVSNWLDSISLHDYKEAFVKHEISGEVLLSLERRDFKDLGVTKVGHLKKLQQGIKELSVKLSTYERSSHM